MVKKKSDAFTSDTMQHVVTARLREKLKIGKGLFIINNEAVWCSLFYFGMSH